MSDIDISRCRLPPFNHQILGIRKILDNPYFGIFDEMGVGKTKQCIDGAQILFDQNIIDKVLIIAPLSVKYVWFDPELGELSKHLWIDIPNKIVEYHAQSKSWKWGEIAEGQRCLEWVITNYEFIRAEARLQPLLSFCTPRTLLILDEANAIKSHRAEQTKACFALRKKCGRILILTGTPIANSIMDMFTLGNIMHPSILNKKSFFQFRSAYALMGGFLQKQIIGYQNLEDLQNRFKPYVIRRLKRDCLDLPPALPSVQLTVTLSEKTWKIYKEMRDEMVSWLSETHTAYVSQAAVKSMRLAQITSGFLGGVEELPALDVLEDDFLFKPQEERPKIFTTEEIGREKLDFLLKWYKDKLEADPNFKLITWFRFIPELARFLKEFKVLYPNIPLGNCSGKVLLGGKNKKEERDFVYRLLNPQTAPKGPAMAGGTYGTGSLGLNFTASDTMMNSSYDYANWKFEQASARIDRPGQTRTTNFFDLVAVGPKGQKTIDHTIIKARNGKADVAKWTAEAWRQALTEE